VSNVDEWDGKVPGAFNLRDLGGNPVAGGTIAPGRVFRCDLLHRVDAELGARWLHQNDVRTLIDLRTLGEREGDGFMAASEHLDSLHRGLLDEVWSWEAENAAEDDWFLRDRTLEMYERFPDRIAQVLGDIAAAPANVLFHCTAGKDRTGVIASALLGVLGATPQVIAADYALSTQAMAGIVGWYRSLAGDIPHDPEREQQIVDRAATVATMAGVVEEIERRHGSFAGWARDAGIGDDLIEALRAKLVVS
jgi:protein-tyrosine phosphatase